MLGGGGGFGDDVHVAIPPVALAANAGDVAKTTAGALTTGGAVFAVLKRLQSFGAALGRQLMVALRFLLANPKIAVTAGVSFVAISGVMYLVMKRSVWAEAVAAAPAATTTAEAVAATAEAPSHLLCPITQELFVDPVVIESGHTFERAAIAQWLAQNPTCPKTRQRVSADALTPNFAIRQAVASFAEASVAIA
jgi:hypothetical protein